jgi:uncharacterized protein (DUF849 family)
MLLQAAINGARAPATHPALPTSAAQFAEAASGAIRIGADEVHLHVRGADGRESLHPATVAQIITAVRQACPAPLGVSTGAWIESDPDRRLALVSQWRVRPDFASVNFDEPGAPQVAQALLDRGVGVEAGLANVAAAEVLTGSGLLARCLRILLEPNEEDVSAALTTVSRIEQILDRGGQSRRRLLHGTGPTTWPLLLSARERGYDTRIGLEDTLVLPDGRMARNNAELVAAAMDALGLEAPRRRDEPAE